MDFEGVGSSGRRVGAGMYLKGHWAPAPCPTSLSVTYVKPLCYSCSSHQDILCTGPNQWQSTVNEKYVFSHVFVTVIKC